MDLRAALPRRAAARGPRPNATRPRRTSGGDLGPSDDRRGSPTLRLTRSERIRLAPPARAAFAVAFGTLLFLAGCGPNSASRVAGRVLDGYRRAARLRPLPEAGSIRLRLAGSEASSPAGSGEIEWEGRRYRETVSSAGFSTIRGIQADRAFFTDEDGVTRVGSEPMLAELVTRSYFWRRAYLFADRERAKISLGPSDASTVSVRLRPRGGNDLLLVFDANGTRLERVESPRFRLTFESPSRFRDASRRHFAAEIAWTGLPTRRLPDPTVGGWKARFTSPFVEAPLEADGSAWRLPAEVAGVPARLALDADADGPLRVSPELARRAGLSGARDVFGRALASGASLAVGGLPIGPLVAEIADTKDPAADAVAGAVLFRETIVEIDPAAERIRLHDPARWPLPERFGRNLLDDDGNLPAAILVRAGRRLRFRAGVRDTAALSLAGSLAVELGVDPASRSRALAGLVWGSLRLPPLPVRIEDSAFDPAWGDDGALGIPLLSRFHLYYDLPHRWIYVQPLAGYAGQSAR